MHENFENLKGSVLPPLAVFYKRRNTFPQPNMYSSKLFFIVLAVFAVESRPGFHRRKCHPREPAHAPPSPSQIPEVAIGGDGSITGGYGSNLNLDIPAEPDHPEVSIKGDASVNVNGGASFDVNGGASVDVGGDASVDVNGGASFDVNASADGEFGSNLDIKTPIAPPAGPHVAPPGHPDCPPGEETPVPAALVPYEEQAPPAATLSEGESELEADIDGTETPSTPEVVEDRSKFEIYVDGTEAPAAEDPKPDDDGLTNEVEGDEAEAPPAEEPKPDNDGPTAEVANGDSLKAESDDEVNETNTEGQVEPNAEKDPQTDYESKEVSATDREDDSKEPPVESKDEVVTADDSLIMEEKAKEPHEADY